MIILTLPEYRELNPRDKVIEGINDYHRRTRAEYLNSMNTELKSAISTDEIMDDNTKEILYQICEVLKEIR